MVDSLDDFFGFDTPEESIPVAAETTPVTELDKFFGFDDDPIPLTEPKKDGVIKRTGKSVGKGVIKILDIIDRPDRAFRTLLRDVVDKGELTPLKSLKGGFFATEPDIGTLIPKEFRQEKPVLGTLADIGLTIATSPTSFFAGFLGGLTKAGRLAKSGQLAKGFQAKRILSKAAKSGKDLSKPTIKRLTKLAKRTKGIDESMQFLGKNIAERVAKGQQALLEFKLPFVKQTAKIKGQKVIEATSGLFDTIKGLKPIQKSGLKFGLKPVGMSDEAWDAFKQLKAKTLAEKMKGIRGSREQGEAINDFIKLQGLDGAEVSQVLQSIEDSTNIQLTKQQKVKTIIESILLKIREERKIFDKPIIDDGFVPHVLSKKRRIELGQFFKVWSTKSPQDFHRNIKALDESTIINLRNGTKYSGGKSLGKLSFEQLDKLRDLEDAGEGLAHASIKQINTAMGKKFFTEDAGKIVETALRNHAKQKAGIFFEQKAKRMFGTTARQAETDIKIDDLFYNEAVADEMQRVLRVFGKNETAQLEKSIRLVTNQWKTLATVLNVSFHTRNAISNVVQNFIGGVSDPIVYLKSGELIVKLRKGKLSPSDKKIIDLFRSQNLDSIGWLSGDIAIGQNNKILGAALGAGKAIEEHAKLAHFIDKLGKGWSAQEAGRSVRKYLFDYADLTPFEKRWMKLVFPFYTFTKKNLAMHAATLIENPQRLLALERGLQAIERLNDGEQIPSKFLPEYMQLAHPLMIKSDENGRSFINLDGFLASTDIDEFGDPRGLPRAVANMLTPLVKIPIQLISGYDWFRDRKFEDMPEQEFLSVNMPPALALTLQQIFRPLAEADKLINTKYAEFDGRERVLNSVFGLKVKKLSQDDLIKSLVFMSNKDANKTKQNINQAVRLLILLEKAGEETRRIVKAKKKKDERLRVLTNKLTEDISKGADFIQEGIKFIEGI